VKGSGRQGGGQHGSVVSIEEEGVRFRSYRDGAELFISPEVSMQVQAALGSDIALAFDECTPFHAGRDYTARSTERTHRWLDRCLAWHAENGPQRQAVFGIVQGGVHEDLRRESAGYVSAAGVDGLAIGGTLGRDKEEMRAVLAMTTPLLPEDAPKHLLGIGEVDDLLAGIALGLDVFDCAVPTRLARHGVALVSDSASRFRLDLRKAGHEGDRSPIADGCPCPACRNHDRDYISYLSRAEELTAVRLICLHNLTFLQELMAGARAAIGAGAYGRYADSIMAGTPPWGARP
jgi:queuine tRNA-ribosyltransferase